MDESRKERSATSQRGSAGRTRPVQAEVVSCGGTEKALPKGIQLRRSARTGLTFFYGDFRRYQDVGGKVEPLRAAGAATATSCPEEAALLYQRRVEALEAARARLADEAPASDRLLGHRSGGVPESDDLRQLRRLKPMIAFHLTRKGMPQSGVRASTVALDARLLSRLLSYFGNCRLTDITPRRLDDYVLRRQQDPGIRTGTLVSASAIRGELHALSSLCRRAVAIGVLDSNPVSRMVDKPRVPVVESEYLTGEEAGRLLDAARALDDQARRARIAASHRKAARALGDARRVREARALRQAARDAVPEASRHPMVGREWAWAEALIATLLYTGGRASEVLGLVVDQDIDFESGRVHFRRHPHRRLKRDHHARSVPMWPPLEAILRRYLQQSRITTGLLFRGRDGKRMLASPQKVLGRCVRQAGFGPERRISPHTLRHTYATMLLQTLVCTPDGRTAVRSSWETAKLLGHRGSSLVDRVYGHAIANPSYWGSLDYERFRAGAGQPESTIADRGSAARGAIEPPSGASPGGGATPDSDGASAEVTEGFPARG